MGGRLARAVAAAAIVIAVTGCDMILGPAQTDTNWHTYDRGHFTFYVRPNSFAERSVDTLDAVLNDQFAVSVAALQLKYSGHIAMFLHNTGSEAGFGDDPGGGARSGVAYPKTETVKATCAPPLDAGLYSLLTHEANHVIAWNGLGRPGTTLLSESLANALISDHYQPGPAFFFHYTVTHRNELPRVASLADDDKWTSVSSELAYNVGASFLIYLLQTYGATPMRAIYPVPSAEFAQRFKEAYGITLDQAEAAWLAFCDLHG